MTTGAFLRKDARLKSPGGAIPLRMGGAIPLPSYLHKKRRSWFKRLANFLAMA